MKKHRTKPHRALSSSIDLTCPFCGSLDSIAIDEGGGAHQTYIEDCAVCCRPRVVHLDASGDSPDGPDVWLERM
jgi:hypothetical protein